LSAKRVRQMQAYVTITAQSPFLAFRTKFELLVSCDKLNELLLVGE
jgi:hypothetical protein